ncbi:ABC transporter substrate-binding protein [Pannonibacter sp. Pt2-lr]
MSSTDIDVFQPVIEGYIQEHPSIAIHYIVSPSQGLYDAVAKDGEVFDLVISSAMDLQMKLANDGLTQPLRQEIIAARPSWARWRDRLVGVAQEPAVVLLADEALAGGLQVPRTRRDLINLMRDNPERFRGRIGTYDPAVAGAGYLFAAQDARMSDTFWRLAEVMGRLDARLYCCSGEMIADIQTKKLLIAYNVLGSYMPRDKVAREGFEVIELEDFTITLLRTALVPSNAPYPGLAQDFLAFLVSPSGQKLLTERAGLPPIDPGVYTERPHLRPIRLDPGLLAQLDKLTRARFLEEWHAAMEQP